jgi:hypothetical protein
MSPLAASLSWALSDADRGMCATPGWPRPDPDEMSFDLNATRCPYL